MTLYNAKTEGDSLRVTKFDSDMNVEASYLTDTQYCTCPAGIRPTCRHRQMLPSLRKIANTEKFFDYQNQLVIGAPRVYGAGDEDEE